MTTRKKSALGRNLSSMLSEATLNQVSQRESADQLRQLPLDVIRPGRYQPRSVFDQDKLEELASSIRAQGVVQPVVVRETAPGEFELIAGERRWRAAQIAALDTIPAVVRDVPDEASVAMSLIENIQREDLNPLEEAGALRRLIDEFQMTHREAADAVGRSRAAVSNLLRLLELMQEVKDMVDSRLIEMGHARALLSLDAGLQVQAAREVVNGRLSVRDTEALVRRLQQPKKKPGRKPDPDILSLQNRLAEALCAAVKIQHRGNGKGKLVISYNTTDELDMDSVFFNFDVAAEYQASYGRENGYMMSFAGLLLTLDFAAEEKEPLLVYMVQYGLDLYGLVEAGHSGWHAHGGHGTGRKFPILLAGLMLNHEGMQNPQANFGEDMQTIWVNQTLPAGTYQQTWHSAPQIAAYGGHIGLDGESYRSGWGPYEHLPPSQWKETLGEGYRRCCTSVSWIGEALAARLIPGMMQSWDHPQFFHYADRWMMTPDLQEDLDRMASEAGYSVSGDFRQQQSWKILSGGGYYQPHRTFVDEMWAAYRDYSAPACAELGGSCCADGLACSGMQRHASDCEICCVGECQLCGNGVCDGPENCSTCPEDCGACQAVCGNGICEGGETCSSCPQDCGACVCVHPAEKEPCDGCLDTAELLAYVRLWKTEGAAMAELMQAIRIWKQGC